MNIIFFLNNLNNNADSLHVCFFKIRKYMEVCSCSIRTTMANYLSLVLQFVFQFTL